MANVRFFTCTSSQLETFSSKVEGDLFFVSNTNTIYRYNGSSLESYGGSAEVEFVTTSGDPTTGKQDVLYINSADKTVKVYNGTSYVTVAQYVAINTAVGPATGAGAATDNDVPTSAAVRTAIDGAIAANIVDVSSSTSASNAGLAPQLGSDGKLPTTVLPALAISEFVGSYTSWSNAAAASAVSAAQKGDYLIISSGTSTPGADDGTWILNDDTAPTTQSNWTRISTPDTDTQYSSGTGIEVTNAGVVNLLKATSSTIGGVKINGNNLSIANDGTLSATNTWRPVKVGSDTLDDTASTIEFAATGDATVTYDSTNKKITIGATDTTYEAGNGISITGADNTVAVKLSSDATNSLSFDSGSLKGVNTWRPVKVGSDTLNDNASTLEFAAGGDATVAYDSTNKKITFSCTNTTYSAGTAIQIDANNSNAVGLKYDSNSALAVNGSGQLTIQWQTIPSA